MIEAFKTEDIPADVIKETVKEWCIGPGFKKPNTFEHILKYIKLQWEGSNPDYHMPDIRMQHSTTSSYILISMPNKDDSRSLIIKSKVENRINEIESEIENLKKEKKELMKKKFIYNDK